MTTRYQEVGRAALLAIAENNLRVPDEQWDMAKWRKKRNCGTVGCAIGHGYALPEVRRSGLRPDASGWPTFGIIDDDGFLAISKAFGIPEGDVERLFHQEHYGWTNHVSDATQSAVSQRIRDYVAQRDREEGIA